MKSTIVYERLVTKRPHKYYLWKNLSYTQKWFTTLKTFSQTGNSLRTKRKTQSHFYSQSTLELSILLII